MRRMGTFIWLATAVVVVTLPAYSATQAAKRDEGAVQDKYHVIQVEGFEKQSGVDSPPTYLASVPQQVIQRLRDSKKFTHYSGHQTRTAKKAWRHEQHCRAKYSDQTLILPTAEPSR